MHVLTQHRGLSRLAPVSCGLRHFLEQLFDTGTIDRTRLEERIYVLLVSKLLPLAFHDLNLLDQVDLVAD